MAITEERKKELVDHYREWLTKSQAVILTEYTGMGMKEIDNLRARVREAGGEFHVVKNTLGRVAFQEAGMPLPENFFEGSTAVGFAFNDAPALAKVMVDYARTSETFKIKGGYLEARAIDPKQVTSLAELPPLPVMRATLLGTLLAPASQLVRTLAEPARGLAAVVKAYSERETATAGA